MKQPLLSIFVAFVVWCSPQGALSALPIELEVATEPGLSLTAPQAWARRLGRLGLASVRLRAMQAGDQPRVMPLELSGKTRFRVVAILNSREELVLPDRRFRLGEHRALQTYFDQLSNNAAELGVPVGRFGLTEKAFRQVYADLSQPVGFSTTGMTARELLARLEKTFSVPVVRPTRHDAPSADPLKDDLSQFSAGTALAIALRREGLMLYPEKPQDKKLLQLTIAPFDRRRESWPVGWAPSGSPRSEAPKLYGTLTLEIGNYTLQQALDALAPRIGVPVVFDDWTLARREIEPGKISVKLARKKTILKMAVDRLLSQARLAGEVRVDEQDQPFLWVTQFGKDSPRAAK